jgi:hypothetical protein
VKKTAPYKPGDSVSLLYYDARYGTCLSTSKVEQVRESLTNGYWEIAYTQPDGTKRTTVVDARGRDRHGYVAKKVA